MNKTQEIRNRIESHERQAQNARDELQAIHMACGVKGHKWGEVKYAPVYHEGYHFPGDPPGTMGVDRQLPCDIPPRTDKFWTRECKECGLVQTTSRTKPVSISGRVPGTSATCEEPTF